jgi:hypothetical protein
LATKHNHKPKWKQSWRIPTKQFNCCCNWDFQLYVIFVVQSINNFLFFHFINLISHMKYWVFCFFRHRIESFIYIYIFLKPYLNSKFLSEGIIKIVACTNSPSKNK